MKVQKRTTSAEETERLAEAIGSRLRGGEIIELVSDVGGGKTTFVRGLARGAGSADHVASPTFTVSKVYKTPTFTIHHFDFYRLQGQNTELIAHEVQDLLDDDAVVVVAEWAQPVEQVLPQQRVRVQLRRISDEVRGVEVQCPAAQTYLLEGIEASA